MRLYLARVSDKRDNSAGGYNGNAQFPADYILTLKDPDS